MAQCTAKSKRTGERCKQFCSPGKTVCRWHGGNSPGAPKGSKNALKHGAYETITRETMFDDEIAFADKLSIDPISSLREQYRILCVKERRILKRMKQALISEQEAGKDDGTGKKKPSVTLLTVSTVQTQDAQGGTSKVITSNSETHEMHYLRLEAAHTAIIDQKRRLMDNLAKLEAEKGESGVQPASIAVRIVDGRVHDGKSDMPDDE